MLLGARNAIGIGGSGMETVTVPYNMTTLAEIKSWVGSLDIESGVLVIKGDEVLNKEVFCITIQSEAYPSQVIAFVDSTGPRNVSINYTAGRNMYAGKEYFVFRVAKQD